jgi:hypothetical protein
MLDQHRLAPAGADDQGQDQGAPPMFGERAESRIVPMLTPKVTQISAGTAHPTKLKR